MQRSAWVVPLGDLTPQDRELAGPKMARLGELLRIGVPVPQGFVITSASYKTFLERGNLSGEIRKTLDAIKPETEKIDKVEDALEKLRGFLQSAEMPAELRAMIHQGYADLCKSLGVGSTPVAVRSSATSEDAAEASLAGQFETYLGVGEEDLEANVKKCWASLFTPRAVTYLLRKHLPIHRALMAVGVQALVDAKSAGVAFTLDPVTGDSSKIVIEGSWGLGESVVQGRITPDRYVLDKRSLAILTTLISNKTKGLLYDPARKRVTEFIVPKEAASKPCLSQEHAIELARLTIQIERHYDNPQDIEWVLGKETSIPQKIQIVQCRPETVWSARKSKKFDAVDYMIESLFRRKDR